MLDAQTHRGEQFEETVCPVPSYLFSTVRLLRLVFAFPRFTGLS
jgi:hypothetical protein